MPSDFELLKNILDSKENKQMHPLPILAKPTTGSPDVSSKALVIWTYQSKNQDPCKRQLCLEKLKEK